MALWINVMNLDAGEEGLRSGPSAEVSPMSLREGGAILSRRMVKSFTGPYVIEAFAQTNDGIKELGDLVQVAFELGRKYERDLDKNNKKKK